MAIASINPATGETVRTFPTFSSAEIEKRLDLTAKAAKAWRRAPISARTSVVRAMGDVLLRDREKFARLMTLEMGKPIKSARDEVTKCAGACHWFAEHAQAMLAPEDVAMDKGERARVEFHPIGPVLAVMPWNFPFWQVIRFAAPAICAGNVGLLKHASNVPQCALALEELAREAGAPDGVFQTLLIGSEAVEAVIADHRVEAVTLTGSNAAGASVGAAAGKAIKKSVLELGGSDPFIVMPSADVEKAGETAVKARAINNGQSCICAKRFIVHERVWEKFVEQFVSRFSSLVVGDPTDEKTDIGPLATEKIRAELHEQVTKSVSMGAKVLLGGEVRSDKGWFYEPTVIVDAPHDAPVLREETFGPVAAIERARDASHALELANDSQFGLGAAIWTNDEAEATRFTSALDAGTVVVNGMVASDARLPFGGVKRSGYGRELADFGMREFLNIKTIRLPAPLP